MTKAPTFEVVLTDNRDGTFTAVATKLKWTFRAATREEAERYVRRDREKYARRYGYSLSHVAFGGTNIRRRMNEKSRAFDEKNRGK